jgi:hypothetical protein
MAARGKAADADGGTTAGVQTSFVPTLADTSTATQPVCTPHLLVAPLHATVPLIQVHHIAVVVSQDLDLDVARILHVPSAADEGFSCETNYRGGWDKGIVWGH